MTKNFKLFTVLLTVALMAGVTIFYACKKEKELAPNTSVQDFIKRAHKGAVVHNEGLAYVYAKLAEIKPKEEVLKIVEIFTLDFIKTNSFFKSDVEVASKNAKITFELLRNSKSSRANLWYDDDTNLLSKSQKQWLTFIDDIIKNNNDLNKMISELDKIEKNVIEEGSDEDQFIVIFAVELGKESLTYWYEHHVEWEQLAPENLSKGWFNWGNCARDDLAGGICGAIGGAIGGGGAGVVPGAIGGALGGSAANAISQCWDHWF